MSTAETWVVWKFPLKLTDEQEVTWPGSGEPLAVGIQGNRIMLWARVRPEGEPVTRRILIRGTGYPTPGPRGAAYIGMVFVDVFVWHIFDGGVV